MKYAKRVKSVTSLRQPTCSPSRYAPATNDEPRKPRSTSLRVMPGDQ
jgi:hypothetical protein